MTKAEARNTIVSNLLIDGLATINNKKQAQAAFDLIDDSYAGLYLVARGGFAIKSTGSALLIRSEMHYSGQRDVANMIRDEFKMWSDK